MQRRRVRSSEGRGGQGAWSGVNRVEEERRSKRNRRLLLQGLVALRHEIAAMGGF